MTFLINTLTCAGPTPSNPIMAEFSPGICDNANQACFNGWRGMNAANRQARISVTMQRMLANCWTMPRDEALPTL